MLSLRNRKYCLYYLLFASSKRRNWGSLFRHQTRICSGESCAVWHVFTLIHIEAFGLIYCCLCQPLKWADVTQTARWPRLRRSLCWQPRSQLRNPKTTQWHNQENAANTERKVTVPIQLFTPGHRLTKIILFTRTWLSRLNCGNLSVWSKQKKTCLPDVVAPQSEREFLILQCCPNLPLICDVCLLYDVYISARALCLTCHVT